MKYEVELLSHKSFIYTFKKFQKVLQSSRKFVRFPFGPFGCVFVCYVFFCAPSECAYATNCSVT